MPLQKLTSTDAFVFTDIADVPSTGIVRAAKKILQGGAKDLARSASYTFAAFEMQRGGASAGINAAGDEVGPAVDAFVEELTPQVADGQVHLSPAKGVPAGALAPLVAAADRNAAVDEVSATVSGVVAAVDLALGGLDGRSVVIEGAGPVPTALVEAVQGRGATVVEVEGVAEKPWLIWGAEADAVLAGSKAGALTHQGVPFFKAKALVPWGPIPATTKAFADLRRSGVTVLPDFVTAGGGLLAGYLDGDAAEVDRVVAEKVTGVLGEVLGHGDGPLMAACYRAEAYLAGWTDAKLFGRPLAS